MKAPEAAHIQAWLFSLSKTEAIALNARTAIEVEKLLRVLRRERDEQDPAAYAFALASLLAKDEYLFRRVVEHFQDFFKVDFPLPWKPFERSPPPVQQSSKALPRRKFLFISLGLFMLVCAALLLVWLGSRPGAEMGSAVQPPIDKAEELDAGIQEDGGVRDAATDDAGQDGGPELELVQAAETHPNIQAPHITLLKTLLSRLSLGHGIAAFLSLFLGLFAARAFYANLSFEADLREAKGRVQEKRMEAAKRETKKQGVLYRVEHKPLLPQSDQDDAATLLGRLTRPEAGSELDVSATIGQTIEEGGRVRPVYAPGRRPEPLVVLVDIEQRGHPLLRDVEDMLLRWKGLGVPMVRYDFGFRPLQFKRHGDGRSTVLKELAHLYEGARVLMISRMIFPEQANSQMEWLNDPAFKAWPQRAWLDLDPRAPRDRAAEDKKILGRLEQRWSRFPYNRDGLLACASWLLTRGQKSREPREPALPSLEDAGVKEALQLWAAAASCVPDPDWAHLESLREALPEVNRQLPDARGVQRLLEWVGEKGYVQDAFCLGPQLRLKQEAKDELIAELRKRDAKHFCDDERGKVEYRTRKLLIEQMKKASVGDDAYEEMRRRMKMAVHEAIMDERKVEQLRREYGESEVAEELYRLLDEEFRRQEKAGLSLRRGKAWTLGERGMVRAWTQGRQGVRLGDLGKVWRWDFRQGIAAVAGLVMVVVSWGEWMEYIRPEASVLTPATWKLKVEERERDALANVAPMRFVKLPGGKFKMGSPKTEVNRNDNEEQHPAEVLPFEIAIYEVTQKQWTAVMGTKAFDCDYGCGDELPAQNISWEDAVGFMNKLTELENKTLPQEKKWTLCYEQKEGKWVWEKKCTGYRLPTEAEWEYAVRAGTETAYSFGEDEKELCKHGNGADISAKGKHKDWTANEACDDGYADLAPVGKFKSNPWGLYDMHGNIWEWVWDEYAPYPKAAEAGYAGPETTADVWRMVRGGSFVNGPWGLRSSARIKAGAALGLGGYGFRCVRGAPQP